MRWCISIGAVLVAGAIAGGEVASIAAPDFSHHDLPSVDIELVIGVDVSYSMDIEELVVQREGYAQAIVSREFLQALKTGPNRRLAVIYFEWSASSDQNVIVPWRLIDGPESADAVAAKIVRTPFAPAPRFLARSISQCHCSMKIPIAGCGV